MFFNEQKFEGFDLNGYEKNDISIPKTDIHIYEFSCKQANDEDAAKKLDELTQRLEKNFKDQFITICSESSQFFCKQLYPLIVDFETKLRYALYISRSLFENGNVNKDSFLIDDANKKNQKKRVEEAEFGDFYKFVFSPENFYTTLKTLINSEQMTKSEYIEKIKSLDDSTMWQNWVGDDYNFIQENFIAIKDFRNDVMHNHLIDFECYKKAKEMLKEANDTLDRAINDKLIVNGSKYLNDVNIFETLSSTHKNHSDNGLVGALAIFAAEAKYYEELQKTGALSEAAKASAMFRESNALAEAAKASAIFRESNALAEAVKANATYQELSALQAKLNADPAVQKYRAMKAELNAIAVSAAENLANNNSENDLKGVSDKKTKPEADDNSPPTQQNEDGSLKEQDDMEDNPND